MRIPPLGLPKALARLWAGTVAEYASAKLARNLAALPVSYIHTITVHDSHEMQEQL